ncbi:MAG: hypothetical protein LBR73_07040 [Oscillospiraceae bacterium]|jgi:5-methyltetrahydrofolate--homocysteine methyltransferase|nr:hypothetical protein [Oscillospiraceae bacterium]
MIHFTPADWKRIRETYAAWWDNRLPRALMGGDCNIYPPDCPDSGAPWPNQSNIHDFSVPPEAIAQNWARSLSRKAFIGDAFPCVTNHAFGPGVMAAFLGAKLDNATGRVWFCVDKPRNLADMHFEYDPDNPWLKRVKALTRAAAEAFEGNAVICMTDIGGVMDVLQSFRPGELLPLDLYDDPENVVRLLTELEALWRVFYADLRAEMRGVPGYSDWLGVYSDAPSYTIQCDFAYMISPDMFRRFVRPTLVRQCAYLERSTYHLDGIGQLAHLDDLLTIPNLRAVQWQPGDGKPTGAYWADVLRKIRAAGKGAVVSYDGYAEAEAVIAALGSGAGLHFGMRSIAPEDLEKSIARIEAIRRL